MSLRCSVCNHPESHLINAAILSGEPHLNLARQYGFSTSALSRHHQHLNGKLIQARKAQILAQTEELLQELLTLKDLAFNISKTARETNNQSLALQAIREVVHIINTITKLKNTQEIDQPHNLLYSEEWRKFRQTIINILEPYPDIRLAVSDALQVAETS